MTATHASSTRSIFFYDDADLLHVQNVTLVPGPVEKVGLSLTEDRASDMERAGVFAGSIVPLSDGRMRLYYSATSWSGQRLFRIAMAESTDGIHWEKPDLGQIDLDGVPTNHIWPEGMPDGANCTQPQVLRLPDGSWRMWFWWHGHDVGRLPYVACESADGIHWKVINLDQPCVLHPADCNVGQAGWVAGLTAANPDDRFAGRRTMEWMDAKRLRSNDATFVYHDEQRQRFEMYSVWLLPNSAETGRQTPHDNAPHVLRTIHRRESDDGLHWSDPELLITPDDRDPMDLQFYHLAVERQGNWRVGFLGHYRCWAQTMDIELCFSRDGRHWHRPLRGSFVPRGGSDELEHMFVYPTNRCIDRSDRLRLLCFVGNYKHNWQLPEGVTEKRHGTLAVDIQRDRWAGLCATERCRGRIELKPFIRSAPELTINADIRGSLRAELRDPFGKPIPGYDLTRGIAVHGDSHAHVLRWQDGITAAPYRYDAVRLMLELDDATVYSIGI